MWIASVFVFTWVNLNTLKYFSFFKIFGSLWRRPVYCDTVKDGNHNLGEKGVILLLLYIHLSCTKCCSVFIYLLVLINSFSA